MSAQSQLIIAVLIGVLLALLLAGPRLWRAFSPRLGKMAGDAYQKRFFKQLKKQFTLLAERVEGFDFGPESQAALQGTFSRMPPQEAMKLQAEFNRLRENFMVRHPELAPLFEAGQDARAQAKAMDTVLKLPAPQRQAIEKDLLWAWDQLRGRFPRLVGTVEATFRKKTEPAPEPAKR